MYLPIKASFQQEASMETFSDKQKLREFTIGIHLLKKHLNECNSRRKKIIPDTDRHNK